jgi:hypothetical protein
MKPNAHLYLPRSVIDRWLASAGGYVPKVQESPQSPPGMTAEQLDGGCVLYRLARAQNNRRLP